MSKSHLIMQVVWKHTVKRFSFVISSLTYIWNNFMRWHKPRWPRRYKTAFLLFQRVEFFCKNYTNILLLVAPYFFVQLVAPYWYLTYFEEPSIKFMWEPRAWVGNVPPTRNWWTLKCYYNACIICYLVHAFQHSWSRQCQQIRMPKIEVRMRQLGLNKSEM